MHRRRGVSTRRARTHTDGVARATTTKDDDMFVLTRKTTRVFDWRVTVAAAMTSLRAAASASASIATAGVDRQRDTEDTV